VDINNLVRVGVDWITHPYPKQVVSLNKGKAADAHTGGNLGLPRNFHALPVIVKNHAVVAATDAMTFHIA
jgi:hypothetical protein